MIFIVFCQDAAEGTARRQALMQQHFAHIRAMKPHYLAAGPCPADASRPDQASFLLLEADSEEAARSIMEQDPYFIGGVWKDMMIRPFRPVVGRWLPPGMELNFERD